MLAVLSKGSRASDAGPEAIECRLRHRDGRWLQFEVLHTNLLDDEHVRGIVLNSRDVSERKAFEEQLAHQAFHDSLTGLANRALFADRVEHALARASSEQSGLAVLFVDLDDFKTINDSLGHAAGDQVLIEVARRLAATVRPTDTAARFGGDEFAVLLERRRATTTEATEVAERILEAFAGADPARGNRGVRPHQHRHRDRPSGAPTPPRPTCCATPTSRCTSPSATARAATACSRSRCTPRRWSGSSCAPTCSARSTPTSSSSHYQPVVRLDDMVVSGVEALLRWRHPTRGVIAAEPVHPGRRGDGPDRADRPVGAARGVSHRPSSCSEPFPSDPPLTMASTSRRGSSTRATSSATCGGAIRDSGVDPSTLVLEITESLMMADADLAILRLEELKALGVRLAMDDFGTGYSSLSYLSRFPVDILKMDRSFLESGADGGPMPASRPRWSRWARRSTCRSWPRASS